MKAVLIFVCALLVNNMYTVEGGRNLGNILLSNLNEAGVVASLEGNLNFDIANSDNKISIPINLRLKLGKEAVEKNNEL